MKALPVTSHGDALRMCTKKHTIPMVPHFADLYTLSHKQAHMQVHKHEVASVKTGICADLICDVLKLQITDISCTAPVEVVLSVKLQQSLVQAELAGPAEAATGWLLLRLP